MIHAAISGQNPSSIESEPVPMPETTCPECHKLIPGNAPAGLCPDCLLLRGLDRSPSGNGAFAVTTPQQGASVPVSLEILAECFPQLEILEVLGQGGMGTVYKAKQIRLDRMVAVKIIRPEATGDPAFAERFLREARTLARLNHPNIVAVHDFGEIELSKHAPTAPSTLPGRIFYFIMEYVEGANLRQLMQAGPLPPSLTVATIPQICEALQYAHDEGVVHRDIKPENILLDSKGRVKIADFGLAKIAGRSAADWTLTGTHQVMGTPRYMAPEQMAGSRDVDHRADIYSLAVVFYEMLTGTVPVGHFAPPSQKSSVDVRMDDVILKAMANEPDRRFQSARDLRSSIEEICSASTAPLPHGTTFNQPIQQTGLSTIIDREVLGAWRMIAGDSRRDGQSSRGLPMLLILFLSVVGCLSMLLPWFEISFIRQQTEQNHALPAEAAEPAAKMPASMASAASRTGYLFCQAGEPGGFRNSIPALPGSKHAVFGSDLRTGIMACTLLGMLALLWLLVPDQFRGTVWTTGGALILSAFALLTATLSRIEVTHFSYQLQEQTLVNGADFGVEAEQFPAFLQSMNLNPELVVLQQNSETGEAEAFPAMYRRQIGIRPGFLMPLSISALLLVMSAAGLRRAASADVADSTFVVRRSDSVTITQQELDAGILPELCMLCGQSTNNRITRSIQYQPNWAQAMTVGGLIMGGIPGIIIAIMTTAEKKVACPICHRHQNHWSRLTVLAGVGWLLPILLGALGFLSGYLPVSYSSSSTLLYAVIGLITGSVIGLTAYLIPVVSQSCQLIKCEQSGKDSLTFDRVSSEFASEVRRRQRGGRNSS